MELFARPGTHEAPLLLHVITLR